MDGNADLIASAAALVAEAKARGVIARLLGGVAVRATCPSSRSAPFARTCGDLDFASPAKPAEIEAAFAAAGWEPNREFNLYNGSTRLYFRRGPSKADVFVGGFRMCHAVPLKGRYGEGPLALPLAELLLTKLQVVESCAKDLDDAACILVDHELGEADGDAVNVSAVCAACADDWGLWRTATYSLAKLRAWLAERGFAGAPAARAEALAAAIDAAPKSLKWKARSAIGERARWYDLPEEVER